MNFIFDLLSIEEKFIILIHLELGTSSVKANLMVPLE